MWCIETSMRSSADEAPPQKDATFIITTSQDYRSVKIWKEEQSTRSKAFLLAAALHHF